MATQNSNSFDQDRSGASLPTPPPRDDVRLLVQSPRRLFLYWSFARDPRETLRRAFGESANGFELSARLIDIADDSIAQSIAADGATSLWLDAAPRRTYRAEIGFVAEGSPFVRVLTSAPIETPPDSASELIDDAADFHIDAHDFAQLLAVSGFAPLARAEDAARVALSEPSSIALSSAALSERA
jgi:hypothetical protein